MYGMGQFMDDYLVGSLKGCKEEPVGEYNVVLGYTGSPVRDIITEGVYPYLKF
jgi:hypothetical protein